MPNVISRLIWTPVSRNGRSTCPDRPCTSRLHGAISISVPYYACHITAKADPLIDPNHAA
jgi:hypothetical protein